MNSDIGLSSLLSSVLSDPDSAEKLKGLAESMGLGDILSSVSSNVGDAAAAVPNAAIPTVSAQNAAPSAAVSPDVLQAMGKIAPLMGELGKEDDSTRLLGALRPFLSSERGAKLEEAKKLMALVRIFGAIKGEGLF